MKTTNDIATVDMHADGYPAFDFSAEDVWPMPPAKPYVPKPQSEFMLQDESRGLSKWLAGRLDAVRRLGK